MYSPIKCLILWTKLKCSGVVQFKHNLKLKQDLSVHRKLKKKFTVSLFYLAWGQSKAILNRSRVFPQLDFDKTNSEQMILKL